MTEKMYAKLKYGSACRLIAVTVKCKLITLDERALGITVAFMWQYITDFTVPDLES